MRYVRSAGFTLVLALASQASWACSFGTSAEASLQSVFDGLFSAGVAPNTSNDCVDGALWQTESSVGSATILIELAGNANGNTLGIYDSTSTLNSLELFSATTSKAFITVSGAPGAYRVTVDRPDGSLSSVFATSTFGFYLQQPSGGARLYSESFRNAGGIDQMYAYPGTGASFADGTTFGSNDALIAWEDIAHNGGDYQDMVVLLRDIVPANAPAVPIPAAAWLLGSALLGLGVVGRRRKL